MTVSHILNVRDTILAFMNPHVWLTELCSEKLLEITQYASARKLLWNDPIIMQTAVCTLHLLYVSVCMPVYILLGCVSVLFPHCQHSGLTESCKWKDRAILLAVCLARFPLSLCHSGSPSEPLTEILWRLLCHISSAEGGLTDGQDGQEVRAGGWVAAKHRKPRVCLPLCALESTGRKEKMCVCREGSELNVHVCKGGRKRRLQLFLFDCFCGLVDLTLHTAWIMLEPQPVFQIKK